MDRRSIQRCSASKSWIKEDKQVKSLLLAAVAVMIATVAQAETKQTETKTIYVTPGSVEHLMTKAPFKTVINGNEKLLVVYPSATDQELTIAANEPDGTIGSADLVMINDNNVVEKLHVEVTPFGAPSATVRVISPHQKDTYLCSANTCMNPSASNKGMGDADSVTVTRRKDGSTDTWKHSATPPTPPGA
jgi:hypothetical protein